MTASCAEQSTHVGSRATASPLDAGKTPASDSASPVVSDNPLAPPDSASVVRYGVGLTSSPPGPIPSNVVSSAAALASSRTYGVSDSLQPGSPEVTLRSVKVGVAGVNATDAHLAWVLTWAHSPAEIHGPVTLDPAERERMARSSDCVYVEVVNALTAELEDVRQLCVDK